MKKYTHIIEKCSSFLRTGVSVRLKRHNYTMSEAYWRLRDGKGLVSSFDQDTFRLVSKLITSIRRNLSSPTPLRYQYKKMHAVRTELLNKLEDYRADIEFGVAPEYLTSKYGCVPVFRTLFKMVGKDYLEMTQEKQIAFWSSLPTPNFFDDIKKEYDKFQIEFEWYDKLSDEEKDKIPPPGQGEGFAFDKVWQIRTDFDRRSSKDANINDYLIYIWDIPSQTDERHRDIIARNQKIIDEWIADKKKIKEDRPYIKEETMVDNIISIINSIIIPNIQ